jgi:lysophospholipase L1-like esterase
VFLGDSITQGWNDLASAFPDMKVANRGINGGDTTRGVLIRLQDDVLSLDPAAIVLLIGTNDLEEERHAGHRSRECATHSGRHQEARRADAGHLVPGVPELGQQEPPRRADQRR